MEILNPKNKEQDLVDDVARMQLSRRLFLRSAGLFTAGAALASCGRDDSGLSLPGSQGINLGSGDTGVLNYAYALEQLEAAFYTRVISSPYTGMTATETAYLQDIRDHEIAHREFFKNVLGNNAIPALEVDFSGINFGSRDSVLATARAFEDLGVSAYNGAGRLLTSATNLLVAGKIVSVEARHAALIRDLITPNSFAGSDVIDANGLDLVRTPTQVLAIARPFLKSQLDASNLPS
jgi:hypothetical protein